MGERGGAEQIMEAHQQLIKILEAVNGISRDLKLSDESPGCDSSAIKALLELRKASGSSSNLLPFSLSQHLSRLADSVQEVHNSKPSKHSSLISFVTRRVRSHEVSRLAAEAQSELHALIDRETLLNLAQTLSTMRYSSDTVDADKVLDEISAVQERLSRGFDINLQDLLLKSGIFAELEWVLCNPNFTVRVREKAAMSMKELVLFNKDVFVVGASVKALVSMDSLSSLQILSALIKAIKSPLVDVMEYSGGVSKIVGLLSSGKLEIVVTAMDCVMEIGYFGRKEAIETMINGGLVHRLVELQSSELKEMEQESICREPFWRCVARFAVQLEVGQGLRQREKRAFKQIILSKVREACVSDAESATIVAQVLWGSSP
ncbi:hypothetical protein ACS0TY_021244 [Phlomoides rotata]